MTKSSHLLVAYFVVDNQHHMCLTMYQGTQQECQSFLDQMEPHFRCCSMAPCQGAALLVTRERYEEMWPSAAEIPMEDQQENPQ